MTLFLWESNRAKDKRIGGEWPHGVAPLRGTIRAP
jgi:hypothetical protein